VWAVDPGERIVRSGRDGSPTAWIAALGSRWPICRGCVVVAGTYAPWMTQQAGPQATDSALDAAGRASPVEAVETVTRELGVALGATKVSFLIADLSGRALVRLAHIKLSIADGTPDSALPAPDERRALEESATVLPFDGGPAEQTIRTQQVHVVGPDATRAVSNGGGQWLVLAPVTERGEAIGVLASLFHVNVTDTWPGNAKVPAL
jgi:hypothetical protein